MERVLRAEFLDAHHGNAFHALLDPLDDRAAEALALGVPLVFPARKWCELDREPRLPVRSPPRRKPAGTSTRVAVTTQIVGYTGVDSLTDIGITPSNELFGITFGGAFAIDPATGTATWNGDGTWTPGQNSLDSLPDGRLLVGGGSTLLAVDLATDQKTPVGQMGGGFVFSGDVTARDAVEALGSASNANNDGDHLIAFDLANNTSEDRGTLGWYGVFGLDFGCDGMLYGLVATNPPTLLRVDPDTAQVTNLGLLQGGPSTLWGAAGPAD